MRKEPQSPSFPHSHMPSLNWRTLASHIGPSLESVIAAACNFSPCEPHQNKGCTSSATQAPCDSQKLRAPFFLFRPTSVLVRFVCFLLSHSAVFTARSWRWDSSAPVSCADHIEIMRAKKKGRNAKKNLSQVFLGLVHEFVSIINFLQASVSSSVARHSRALVHTCFAPKSPLRLAREKDTLLGSPPTFC